jgi:3-hydroxyacyl-[acyl-carrier-protein] dehydratase
MAPKLFCDLDRIDPNVVEFSREDIRAVNPQRYEFEQLDSVALYRPEENLIVGVRDIRGDEFWVRGHMPDRPIFPGVLMLESAAQLCSFYCLKTLGAEVVYGFGGADRVRFRKMVSVGDRLLLIGMGEVMTPRRSLFQIQGVVNEKLAFEASILGIALKLT